VVDVLAGIFLDGAGGVCLAGVYNHCCVLSRRSPVWMRLQMWGLLWGVDV
jgi:hypothetical protein